jgi:hypothetical protein
MAQRRTAHQIYAAAEEKIDRARDRRATRLHLGERRRSLRQIPSLVGLSFLRSLTLSETGVSDLSPLADVPQLTYLNLSRTPLWDISPLAKLKELVTLDLSYTSVADLSALAELKNLKTLGLQGSASADLSPLANLSKLEHLSAGNSSIKDVAPLGSLSNLRTLSLEGNTVSDLRPLRSLSKLKDLGLSRTAVVDIAPLVSLSNLEFLNLNMTSVENISALARVVGLQALDLSSTSVRDVKALATLNKLLMLNLDTSQVTDLLPLAELKSLITGARMRHYFGTPGNYVVSGLSFSKCPLLDPELLRLSKVNDAFKRTADTISYLRERRSLPPLTSSDLSEQEAQSEEYNRFGRLRPIENVPSPFAFQLSDEGNIALVESFSNIPAFPNATSDRHHADRLDACRVLAGDLVSDLSSQKFQARSEYSEVLRRYEVRLPYGPNSGNILLADAEARTLRNLFAAEADILSVPLASKLKTFLEQHMGLRVFYPEITHFYRDVQSGRIDLPLPLDAVEAFVREIKANTPNVFDASVTSALREVPNPLQYFQKHNTATYSQRQFNLRRQGIRLVKSIQKNLEISLSRVPPTACGRRFWRDKKLKKPLTDGKARVRHFIPT